MIVETLEEAVEPDCYTLFRPLVRAYVARYVGFDDAEDVTQRVFVEVWRCQDRYDRQRSLRGWVLGIARNRAVDHLRARRKPWVSLESIPPPFSDDGRDLADRFAAADEVESALRRLPEAQSEVVRLAYFGGYTQVEISVLLDCPLGTVKTRTSRGLRALAVILEPGTASTVA